MPQASGPASKNCVALKRLALIQVHPRSPWPTPCSTDKASGTQGVRSPRRGVLVRGGRGMRELGGFEGWELWRRGGVYGLPVGWAENVGGACDVCQNDLPPSARVLSSSPNPDRLLRADCEQPPPPPPTHSLPESDQSGCVSRGAGEGVQSVSLLLQVDRSNIIILLTQRAPQPPALLSRAREQHPCCSQPAPPAAAAPRQACRGHTHPRQLLNSTCASCTRRAESFPGPRCASSPT